MAVRELRTEPAIIERIRRYRKPSKQAPPNRAALSVIRGVVSRSGTTEGAIAAIKAINAAWPGVSSATQDVIDLLLMLLELSDNAEQALTTLSMLRHDGSLLKPLADIQQFVHTAFPKARMHIVPGDEVSSAYLYVQIPTEDYPSFWAAHVRLRDWSIETYPELGPVIQICPRPVIASV